MVTSPSTGIFLYPNMPEKREDDPVLVACDFDVRLQGFPGRSQEIPYVDIRLNTVLKEPSLIPCNLSYINNNFVLSKRC